MVIDGNCVRETHDLKEEPLVLKNIIVSKGLKQLIIPIREIFYFFHENKNVFAVTSDNEVYFCELGLSVIEKEMCSGFFRINRQIIINHRAIKSFSYIENNKIALNVWYGEGRNMIVGKNKVASFKKWIMFDCSCASAEPIEMPQQQVRNTLLRKVHST
ncbi:LytTR family DNA-binding domain-containing protein [Sunxiuqinia elliptica]|uniref:LytTr DNA-binding domain-containing protein n=1 Tax=Sunxiuqinia elliptica TaxID=655355 RepID=A0A4R6H728_9BACT|nr:LytTR family DNA-binding domain-containing protein [Sunxiuqinia elliptica]TDO03784.1 LytTr DNA-binding domain-containing protein [Sunxiuqinia elliptica]TDO62066.1 LytTr DNA-binding domain-containing protein [Sunxiuqinia elliptica]